MSIYSTIRLSNLVATWITLNVKILYIYWLLYILVSTKFDKKYVFIPEKNGCYTVFLKKKCNSSWLDNTKRNDKNHLSVGYLEKRWRDGWSRVILHCKIDWERFHLITTPKTRIFTTFYVFLMRHGHVHHIKQYKIINFRFNEYNNC